MICANPKCGSKIEANTTRRGRGIRKYKKYCSAFCEYQVGRDKEKTKPEWRVRQLLARAKNRAIAKNLPFDLSADYLLHLWEEQGGKCAVSGRTFCLDYDGLHPDTVSIDRITPQLGYVRGNVRLVTYHVNVAISEFGLSAFLNLCSDCIGGA